MLKQPTREPVDALDAPIPVSGRGFFRSIYRFFYSKKVGLFLILATGLLALVGALVRQMPAGVRLDPGAKAGWLEQVRPIYGGWTGVMDAIGFFHIFSSPVFLAVSMLLALSIIACTTHRLPNLYRKAYHPHTRAKPTFFERAKIRDEVRSPLPPAEAMTAVKSALKAKKLRVIEDPDGEQIYSDRFHWAPFGTAAAHAGYVVIMAGFLVSSFAGFRTDNFELTVGIPRDVGFATGFTAEAVSFHDSYDDATGTPIDYVTDLIISRDGQEVKRQDVRVNEPLIIDGVYFHQASFGVSAVVHVQDAGGATLFRGGVPLSWTTPDRSRQYGVTILEEQNLEVFVIANASGGATPGLAAGQARIETYPVGVDQPLGTATLDANAPAQVGDLTVTFEREQKFTSLIVKKDPGTIIVWIGCALLIVGSILTMGLRHNRQLVRVTATDGGSLVQIASADRADSVRRSAFADVSETVTAAVGGRAEERVEADA